MWSHGSLWITGRGTDLLKVNPADGSVQETIEIGASGIDIAADGDDLWVPTRSAAVDQSGFPTMDALKRVSVSTGARVRRRRAEHPRRRARSRRAQRRRVARRQHERLPLPPVNRRQFLATSAVAAGAAAPVAAFAIAKAAESEPALPASPLPVPRDGVIRTAFAIGEGVNVIDTAGPWEVFQDAAIAHGPPVSSSSTRCPARPTRSKQAGASRSRRRTRTTMRRSRTSS